MAGTCNSIAPHVIGSSSTTTVELSRSGARVGPPVSVRMATKSHGGVAAAAPCNQEGPSCIFVGPLETASKETLEALYRQARDAYYSGEPLIVDDMFDRVELKLRWYGSKSVVKYPRCSIRRQSTYADAEMDEIAGMFLLVLNLRKTVMMLFLKLGPLPCCWMAQAGRSISGFCISEHLDPDICIWQFHLSCAYYLHCRSSLSRCIQLVNFLWQSSKCIEVSCISKWHSFHGIGFFTWIPRCIFCC